MFNVAYVEVNSNDFANVGCYTLPDGSQFFDIACIFAANINDDGGQPTLNFNPQVSALLNESDDVKTLQNLGIKVLLTVLGNHQNAGWSCFTDQSMAADFANQLAECVELYGLDGIDIDDEYSTCETNDTSLIMATYEIRQAMPGKIVSKALFDDTPYFQSSWNGMTLADQLTNGWEMSYGDPDGPGRLAPYINAGMNPDGLAVGVGQGYTDPSDVSQLAMYAKGAGIGGMMIYNITNDSEDFLSNVSQVESGQPTVAKPGCLR